MRILFCSRWFPYPPDNGSKIRIFNLIKQLSVRHEVDLVSFTDEPLSDERLAAMQTYCRHVEVLPYHAFQPGRAKAILGFFSRRPRSVVDTYSVEMQSLIDHTLRRRSFDAVVASQSDMALYTRTCRGLPKIFEEVELTSFYEGFSKEGHPLKKARLHLMWWKLSRYMAYLLQGYDGCTVVSERECERVLELSPGFWPVGVVPNGVDTRHNSGDFGSPKMDTLIYSGALTFYANFEAVDFFLREVFPLILAERPQVKLLITGRLDGVPVERLPVNENVIFTGYLDDIRPAIAQSWVNIVPLLKGGGTRLKILEAIALGTPVVATSKGAEGLELKAGRDILIADKPSDFASVVLNLLQNGKLRESLSHSGRRTVETKYDWQRIGHQFCDFVEEIAARRQSA
jgi:glycosyltransferase involved in cell wall biosynthesis